MQAFLKGGSGKTKDKSGPSGDAAKKIEKLVPWVEKYRPRSVDEVAYQEEVVSVLRKSIEGADLPNMLFYGPPGTGKTSTILAAARELYGSDLFRSRVLELNASDERGIQVVRDKVKGFSQQAAGGKRSDGRPCPPYKIVILDEADSMTKDAQAALRRTMEKQTKTTRFCLICNYVSRIIEPLTSRCAKFRFKPLANDVQEQRVRLVMGKENVKCDDEAVQAIIKTSEGDLRKAITTLQSAHRLKGEEGIQVKDIYEIAGVIPDDYVATILKTCSSNSYEQLEVAVKDLLREGYSAMQVISQVNDIIVEKPELNDKQKSLICERLAIADKRLCDGADEYLQIMDLFTIVMTQFCSS
ncbi:replication factor C subunit 4-like [Amphiura filiformis]|uniref:replication factor C subunit 4-like n=1 Tax=Amphiura filiformis TaxID=82378 RepID=UPI003B20E206